MISVELESVPTDGDNFCLGASNKDQPQQRLSEDYTRKYYWLSVRS